MEVALDIIEESEDKVLLQDCSDLLYVSSFFNEKHESNFIKSCERLIRSSYEYRKWLKEVKDTLNINSCPYTEEDVNSGVSIEIHHHPLTLWDVCICCFDELILDKGEVTSFDVAKKVMELHFQMNVGFIPLIKSLHEKFHEGEMSIPIDWCYGNWKECYEKIVKRPEIKEKLEVHSKITLDHLKEQGLFKQIDWPTSSCKISLIKAN